MGYSLHVEGMPIVRGQGLTPLLRKRPKKEEQNPDILEGIPSICRFLNKSYVTVHRWIKYHGLPATISLNGRWITTKQIVIEWLLATSQNDLSKLQCQVNALDHQTPRRSKITYILDEDKNNALRALYSNNSNLGIRTTPKL